MFVPTIESGVTGAERVSVVAMNIFDGNSMRFEATEEK